MRWEWAVLGIGAAAWYITFQRVAATQPADDPGTDPTPASNPSAGVDRVQAIARAIAYAEGYYLPDGSINTGSKPVRSNNPGDIKANGVIKQYASADDGWQALYHQIDLILSNKSAYYTSTMPITQLAAKYTAATGPELVNWAQVVASHLGLEVTDSLGMA